jgi:citrate lyase subunit beta/citryl-CoA lyase
MPVMRCNFFIPGNREDIIAQIPEIPVDLITLDLEDTVPVEEKQKAREIIHQNLQFAASFGADIYVRVNDWETDMTNDDCEAVIAQGLKAIALPKCEEPDEVKRLDWLLEECERRRGLQVGIIRILLLIETAKGVMNVYKCATASTRVNSLMFGVADYVTDMGVTLTQPIGEEQKWARARIACAAKAAGIAAIDCYYRDETDIEGFNIDSNYSLQLGFVGRAIVHRSQIEPCHRIYSPSPDRIDWAKGYIKVYEEQLTTKGQPEVTYNGERMYKPRYLAAKKILEIIEEIADRERKRSENNAI